MNVTPQTVTLSQLLQVAAQHFQQGRLLETEQLCNQALQTVPDNADALHMLGLVVLRTGKPDVALELVGKAVTIMPANPFVHNNLGEIYSALNQADRAVACYGEALRLNPQFAEAHNNLGVALKKLSRYEEAIASYRQALACRPDYAVAYNNLGNALRDLGRLAEARASFEQALSFNPGLVSARFNLALTLLYQGEYAEGFALYEQRFEGGKQHYPVSHELYSRFSTMPRWDGTELHGRRLLIWTEQGMGDSLMLLRFFSGLKEKGAGKIIVYCESGLVPILRTVEVVDEILQRDQFPSFETFDVHCPIMSLPHLFGTTLDTLPAKVPYLRVPAGMDERWLGRLAEITGLKVGLVWAAGKKDDRDITLQDFAPLIEIPGVTFFSLQKGEPASQLAETGWPVWDWMDECKVPFLDTAALVQHLDLVISVDTSVAHLAGALGKPVWLLNRYESEWRWMLEREDSPWYPTMRIFRQKSLHDWPGVIARLAESLRLRVSAAV